MNKKWKFEPDPITRGYINHLNKSPIKFDNLKRQIELIIRKEVEEKLDYLFEQLKDYDFCQEMPLIDVTGDKEKGIIYINLYRNDYSKIVNKELIEKWWKDLCNGSSLAEIAKERGFDCNNDLKIQYRYSELCEKERNLTDIEKTDKNLEILKK